MKSLVIVESPAKAKTINLYLGPDYIVEASIGHVKDLPRDGLAVDIEDSFRPTYEIIHGKEDVILRLQNLAGRCSEVILATDPDREGEAIAHHIAQEIASQNSRISRVLFHEITRSGVAAAMKAPRDIDHAMVEAQEARRVMDRLIGYKVSPFLWRSFRGEGRGLSAGRVQSVAVRLVVERERAVTSFIPIEYWSLVGDFHTRSGDAFKARLVHFDGRDIRNPGGSAAHDVVAGASAPEEAIDTPRAKSTYISTKSQGEDLRARILREQYSITTIAKKEVRRAAPQPFTTSTLQQEASRRLRINPQRTMRLAQNLYEGAELGKKGRTGLITYMRTDSTRVSQEAHEGAEAFIYENYGKEYVPEARENALKPASRRGAKVQDGHEAIRPSDVRITPKEARKHLDKDLADLYELIWNRFVASCMSAALIDQTTVEAGGGPFIFRATGRIVRFKGWLQVYDDLEEDREKKSGDAKEEGDDGDSLLPASLRNGESVALESVDLKQHQTRPPLRYTESLLIREMESRGIGRPSTYASIIGTIQDRGYVEQKERRLYATELGMKVCDALVAGFPALFDVRFTARMEGDLDTIARGSGTYLNVMRNFYRPLEKALSQASGGGKGVIRPRSAPMLATTLPGSDSQNPDSTGDGEPLPLCPQCSAPMKLRAGREGNSFYGCSRYPECRGTRSVSLGIRCPACGTGAIVSRTGGRYNSIFYACARYPECRFTSSHRPVNRPCPKCSSAYLVSIDSPRGSPIVECPQCRTRVE